MITFKREGSKIIINTNVESVGHGWSTSIELNSEPYAILLRKQIQEDLDSLVRGIRQQAYELGYEDKKKRRPKRDWFNPTLKKVEHIAS